MDNNILEAKKQGFSDDEILEYIVGTNSELSKNVLKAQKNDFSSSEILSNLSGISSEELNQYEPERGIIPSFKRGFGQSTSGIITGQTQQPVKDNSIPQRLSEIAGGVIGDLPAMYAGGLAGGAVGGAIGSAIPGAGTLAGTAVGSASGAFALPTLIKESYGLYTKYAEEGFDGTFGEFLADAGNVVKDTGKSAVLGAIVSQAGRLIPVLRRTPKLSKLLDSKVGAKLEEPLAELIALTGGDAIIEQKMPNPSDIAENAAVIGGFRAVSSLKAKAKETLKPVKEITQKKAVAKEELVKPVEDVKPLDIEKPIEDVKLEKEPLKDIPKPKEEIIKEKPKPKEEPIKDIPKPKEAPVDKYAEIDKRRSENTKKNVTVALKKINSLFPERLQKTNEKLFDSVSKYITEKKSTKNKAKFDEYMKTLEKHLGKQRADVLRSQFKWRDELSKARDIGGKERKFSEKELSDMIYYRQRTGNPDVKGDSFEALNERLPKEAKKAVDEVIDKHLKNWLEVWNSDPSRKDIFEREDYLHGVYETASNQTMKDAMDKMAESLTPGIKGFKTEGPFLNPKKYENYKEAFEKAGLKPRYNNIKDLMTHYDNMMIRTMANSELANKIHKGQEAGGERLFVTTNNDRISEEYKQAKKDGWVEFHDPFLRTLYNEDGKAIGRSGLPTLVDPEFAKVFQGVFNKAKGSTQNVALDYYDNLNSMMKIARVSLSPFHIVALAESGIGGMGFKNFFSNKWWEEASKSFEDVDKLAWRAEMGLTFGISDAESFERGADILDKYAKDASDKNIFTSLVKVPAKLAKKSHDWIFREYQPRLKIHTFDLYMDKVVKEKVAKGEKLTQSNIDDIARETAKAVNNQFGGQISELITTMNYNDPNVRKWIRRIAGYPDWGISALRQATDIFNPGVRGKLAQDYWLKYLSSWMMATYTMRFLFGGFKNDEKDNSMEWSPTKAFKSIEKSDSNSIADFPLPDVNMSIAGVKFNPGRDLKSGRKLHSHFGKQALEIPRYITDTTDAIFGKSSPVIQTAFKQMVGGTPYKGELFPVRGSYKSGRFMAWDGSAPKSFNRLKSRTIALIGDFIPFSLKGLDDKGLSTTVATGMGAVPTGRGLSLYASEPYLLDAIRRRDMIKLNVVRMELKDNGYKDAQIRSRIKQLRNFYNDNKNNSLFN